MMLNETYTKNIQPRDPERIRSDIRDPLRNGLVTRA
mgnify:CR=1 FL=1